MPPGGSVKHEFKFNVDRSGVHRGEIRLVEDDGLPLDNHQYFALSVDQQVPVAIVKPKGEGIAYAEDTFYLENALAPGGTSQGAFRVATLSPEDLATEPLAGYTIVFGVNLPALEAPAADKLRDYVRGGGHLFWICGANVQADAYNKMNGQAQGELLPAPLADLRQPEKGGGDSWHIGFLDKDYPALTPLTEPAALYETVLVYKHFPMKWDVKTGGRVLARTDDGQPLLAEKRVGAGSVLLLGMGVHVDWTNLPLKPLFLPLVARLAFSLAGTEAERAQILAGAPIEIPLGGGPGGSAEVEVVRPNGEMLRVREKQPNARTFRYTDTHEAGVYLFRLINAKQTKQYAFAANIDPGESDPATVPREELQKRFGRQPVLFCDNLDELDTTIRRLREGRSLWEPFLALVLLGLIFEVFLANRSSALPTPAAPSPPSSAPPRPPATEAPPEEVAEFLRKL